ncbi:hypothetical protein TSAR_016576 [Trichomalopsis sarcophagae]|uniref:Odorant receptor n=1 Tax=Trichomalopsis sarcophagae TaxID=543379 RepID=A0A232EKM6_9HYME|nr:hypothetical protein TSAR_016576 [Trichomalopsis sarcophagae]
MLSIHFQVLTISGVWCPNHSSSVQRIFYKCYSFIVVVLMYSLALSQLARIIFVKQSFNEFNDTFFISLSTNFACFKAASNLVNQKQIVSLVNMFKHNCCLAHNDSERSIQKQYNDSCSKIIISLLILVETSAFFVVVAPLCGTMDNQDLPYQVLLPYDLSNKLCYWLTFVHHSLGAVLFTAISITNDAVITGFMMHVCGQLSILQHRLVLLSRSLANDVSKKGRTTDFDIMLERDWLRQIVYHQNHISNIAKKICWTFNEIVICQFCISGLEICVSVYQLSVRNNNTVELCTYAIYLMVMLGQFFVYCYFGNEVTLQSKITHRAIFDMDWTSFSLSLKKDLTLIMLYSSKPIAMSCGPFVHLTLESFTNVKFHFKQLPFKIILFLAVVDYSEHFFLFQILKTSYSIFSVLKTTT